VCACVSVPLCMCVRKRVYERESRKGLWYRREKGSLGISVFTVEVIPHGGCSKKILTNKLEVGTAYTFLLKRKGVVFPFLIAFFSPLPIFTLWKYSPIRIICFCINIFKATPNVHSF